MKTMNRLLMVLTFGMLAVPVAQAHDSFNLGINIGGYGYAPPAVVYPYSGPAVYYGGPRVYQPAPRIVYGAPIVSYQYYNGGGYGNNRGWQGRRGQHFDRGNGNGRGHGHGNGRGYGNGHRNR